VAEITGGCGNLNVRSNNDLGMAACASELFAAAYLLKMRGMVKLDVACTLKNNLAFQQSL
jgi:hypothetical protein